MERQTDSTPALVVSGEEFLARLSEEIARSDRYDHPFTILTLRPSDRGTRISAKWLESSALGLTRGCDVVTVLESDPMLMIMLPETEVSGGASVLERMRAALDAQSQDWEFGLFEYPQNSTQLKDLIKRAA